MSQEYPQFVSTKQVRAVKIVASEPGVSHGGALLHVENDQFPPIPVDYLFVRSQDPRPPGYYVLQEGKSPAFVSEEEFEREYRRVGWE